MAQKQKTKRQGKSQVPVRSSLRKRSAVEHEILGDQTQREGNGTPPTSDVNGTSSQASGRVVVRQQNPEEQTNNNGMSSGNMDNNNETSSGNMDNNSGTSSGNMDNNNETSSGNQNNNNGENDGQGVGKKKRGPTYMLSIWGRPSHLPPIKVSFNVHGSPLGPDGHTFSEFLGSIARNPKYCPIDIGTWHEMPNEKRVEILDLIKARFDISMADETQIFKSISAKWRNWKHDLKKKYWKPNVMEYPDFGEDTRIERSQWMNLCSIWNTPESLAKCERNKVARSKKRMNHATGKRSYAEVYETKKQQLGRNPSRAEMFGYCYTKKDGVPSDVANVLAEIEKLRSELPEGEEDVIAPDDIFAKAAGPDKRGYVRMVGTGISPSDVWGDVPGRKPTKRAMMEQKSRLAMLENELNEIRARLASREGESSQNRASSDHQLTPQSLQVNSFVHLKSMADPTKIVAKGFIRSTNEDTEVGGQALGPAFCEVNITVVVHPEEHLIRTYDYYRTLGDALGCMIAWPVMLVTPMQSA